MNLKKMICQDVKKTKTKKKMLSKITIETTLFFLHNWSGSLQKIKLTIISFNSACVSIEKHNLTIL